MKWKRLFSLVLLLGFFLGVHNGYIALWDDDDPTPLYTFPKTVSSLPVLRQEELKKGVPIRSGYELVEILKDYLS